MPEKPTKYWIKRGMPWLIIGTIWLWFCGPMVLGLTVVGFRDSGYLYYPMFSAIDQAWADGHVPLWNPFCNFGMPLVADGTSSVFYPGKLIFWFRFLSFPSRYGIYLASHVMLCAVGTYLLARKLRCRRPAATMAAITYAFGAPAVFQVTNVIFLISAAWLPIALMCVWQMLNCPEWKWPVAAAVCCAMMILGGDPQMVYHVGLIAAVSVGVQGIRQLTRNRGPANKHLISRRPLSALAVRLLVMVVLTSLLAWVQIFPSARLTADSERSADGRIVNVYSFAPNHIPANQISGLNLMRQTDAIVGQYQFSLPPWMLAETLVPNFSGKPFPQHARWADCIPANDRMWYPSLYLGLVTILLAVTQMRWWGHQRPNVWITWILTWFLLGSFGWYGAVWFWRQVTGSDTNVFGWAAPVGGVYWWMSVMLPKYFSFRYPAKLFILASLAISVLAGRSLRAPLISQVRFRWLIFQASLVAVFCIGGWFWVLRNGANTFNELAQNSINGQSMFGPFQSKQAVDIVAAGFVHAGMVLLVFVMALLLLRIPRRVQTNRTTAVSWGGWCIVLLTMIDLSIANRWLMAEVPSQIYQQELNFASRIHHPTGQVATFVLADHFPFVFLDETSPDRMQELAIWQRQSLQPKYHLVEKIRLIGSFHSIWPANYQSFIDELVVQANRRLASQDRNQLTGSDLLLADEAPALEFLSVIGAGEDLRILAAELPGHSTAAANGSNWKLTGHERIEIRTTAIDWNRNDFQVDIQNPLDDAWVEFPVLFDDGWDVQIQSSDRWQTANIRRSGQDLTEIQLPGSVGKYDISMRYRPRLFYLGAGLSASVWLGVLIWWVKFRKNSH